MSALGRAIPAAFLVAVGLTALRPIDDADFWWLLRAGRYMVETRSFLTADPFSGTAQGAEWLNHAWGFELLVYGLYALAGTTGVILLQGLAASATFGVLYGLLRREGVGRGWSLGLLSLGALATHGFWSPRPQLVTYLILALFARVLADYQAGRREPPVVAPGPDGRVGQPARGVPGRARCSWPCARPASSSGGRSATTPGGPAASPARACSRSGPRRASRPRWRTRSTTTPSCSPSR